MRGPDKGLGPIPASKMRFWDKSQSQKIYFVGPIPQITSVAIPEQHFLSAGIEYQNLKLLALGSDAMS